MVTILPDTDTGWATAALAALTISALLLLQGSSPTGSGGDGGAAMSDDAPSCRICLAGAEEGRLFRPCRCRGTMAWVHPQCLNEWRAVSANARSFFRCDQCGYEYRVRRTRVAEALQREQVVWAVAVALFGALVLVGALVLDGAEQRLYGKAGWQPRAWFAWWGWRADRLVAGALLPGGLGLARAALQKLRRATAAGMGAGGAIMLLSLGNVCLDVDVHLSPALLLLSLLFTFGHVVEDVRYVAKGFLARFGEVVLEYGV